MLGVGCKHSNKCERTTSDPFRFYFTFKPQTKALLKIKYPAGLVAWVLVEQKGKERREGERQGSGRESSSESRHWVASAPGW